MCGIVGVASAQPVEERAHLAPMRDAMRHRGPDDAGEWWDASGRVGLGHRRLSILDLSPSGHQPMHDASGKLHMVFNGEIYNFRELRGELAGLGHSFHTGTDSEVLLAAYGQWGDRCVERLVGMFAFAIFDAARERVFLARDRVGEKPLYFGEWGGVLVFASELKALLRHPRAPRAVDPGALEWYLAYGYVPGGRCILRGTHKLPAGHSAVFDLRTGALESRAYWTLPAPFSGPLPDGEELVDELERLLLDSVSRQLVADVPVAVLLSGGVDSSLVTAAAARASGKPVKTFTVSFPGEGRFDESAHARAVAQHYGTDHTELPVEPATVDLLPQMARQFDEPMADSSMVPTYLVSRLVRREATVALGGDGGDELFGGYQHYSMLLQRERVRRLVPGVGRALVGAVGRALPAGVRGRNHLAGFDGSTADALAAVNLYFDAPARRRLLPGSRAGALRPEEEKARLGAPGATPLQEATRCDFRSYLTDDVLVKVDRASMLTSLEVRAPFLDHRIVEFAFGRVPDEMRATERGRKLLLRRLSSRLLPPEFDATRKQGFSIPLARWFRGPWGEMIADVLTAPDATFSRAAVDAILAGQRRGLNNMHRLFALTLFELWRREYEVTV